MKNNCPLSEKLKSDPQTYYCFFCGLVLHYHRNEDPEYVCPKCGAGFAPPKFTKQQTENSNIIN